MAQRERLALFTIQPRKRRCTIGALTVLFLTVWMGLAAALSPPEYPIVLVHGINGTGNTWDEFLASVTPQGWTFGGQLKRRSDGIYYIYNVRFGGPPRAAHIYTITFTSGSDLTYQQQGEELEGVINYILDITGKSKVICVGHSMGGLACRSYLSYARNPRVSQIITVGTPHLGAPAARLRWLLEPLGYYTVGERILQPNSDELNHLNTDGLFRYRDTPIAYSSIIVGGGVTAEIVGDNDGVVSTRSQNLANVGLQLPLHTEVPIQLRGPCTELALHSCETRDENVRIAITAEVVRGPVAFVLATDTPRTRIGAPLRVRLLSSSARLNRGDLYLGLALPSGTFIFQQETGGGNLGWTTATIPARYPGSRAELATIDLDPLAVGGAGTYTSHALLVRPGESPHTGRRLSNLATVQFVIESGWSSLPRGQFVYVSSHQILGTRYAAPSELWRVEVHPEGTDVRIGTIQTAASERPVITDLARTPTGELYGISTRRLYRIDPATALATLVGELGTDNLVALVSDAQGRLYAMNGNLASGDTVNLYRVDPQTGRATSIGRFPEFMARGASGDLAFDPIGRLFVVRQESWLCLFWCTEELWTIDPTSPDLRGTRIGDLGRTRTFGLAFIGSDLYGFTTDPERTNGSLAHISATDATVSTLRSLSFQASGAALRVER